MNGLALELARVWGWGVDSGTLPLDYTPRAPMGSYLPRAGLVLDLTVIFTSDNAHICSTAYHPG
jgi:hypothetical protein